jgi:membrane protease YdiL (CAAX protease family)
MNASNGKTPPDKPDAPNSVAEEPLNLSLNSDIKHQRYTTNLPQRYAIKTSENQRVLTCLEAPNLYVHIEAGLTVPASVAHKARSGTIYLDGAANCEPFMDHERKIYNLDHHEGCIRAFTMATCEQTLVMYMKGLDLRLRDWDIFVNEPDLDAILAIWIILNNARIGNLDETNRHMLFALVRYEGVIDALGLELKELCALHAELMQKIQRVIDHLRNDEILLKKDGKWTQTDFLTYTATILHKIDQIFYKASDFADYQGIEELARIDLTGRRIAAVVAADMGIYEIEPHLNKLYGNRLGVVFLQKSPKAYTVRQTDLFMPISLEHVYDRLNFVDPAVKFRTRFNKWGGANDIGGSPRGSGTSLTPAEIALACRDAVRKFRLMPQLYRFILTTLLVGLITASALVVRLHWKPAEWFHPIATGNLWAIPDFGFIVALLLGAGICLALVTKRRPWQYGLCLPEGTGWWPLLPVALLVGAFGGVWFPAEYLSTKRWDCLFLFAVVGMPLAVELLFRGLAHGTLAQHARIQRSDSRWFISWPTIGSTLPYGVFSLYFNIGISNVGDISRDMLAVVATAFFGILTGMLRERSHSIWPPFIFHVMASLSAISFGNMGIWTLHAILAFFP